MSVVTSGVIWTAEMVGLVSVLDFSFVAIEVAQRAKRYSKNPLPTFEKVKSLFIAPSIGRTKLGSWLARKNSEVAALLYFRDAKIIADSSVKTGDGALAKIKEHVQKNGTLDELVIDAHQQSFVLAFKRHVELDGFLLDLVKLQREVGKPLTKRLVFSGCNLMTYGTPAVRETISMAATLLNADIVGSNTSVIGYLGHRTGRFVRFGADGSIERDPRLDIPEHPYIKLFSLEPKNSRKDDWLVFRQGFKKHSSAPL